MEKSIAVDEELSPIEKPNSTSFITSITNEWKPNLFINQSVCGSTWHEYYIEDSPDFTLESTECKCSSHSKSNLCKYENKYTGLVRKYYTDTKKLKDKVKELRENIDDLNKENEKIKIDSLELQQEYSLEIQNVQIRHQQKLIRAKNDLENFIKSLEEKLTKKFKEEYEKVLENVRNEYEEKIQMIRNDHEFEIIQIQENSEFDKGIELEEKIKQEFEGKLKEKTQEITLFYEEKMKQMRKEKGLQKKVEGKKVLVINNESASNESDLKEKISHQEKHISELNGIISQQEKTISDITSSSIFRKKSAFTASQVSQILNLLQYFLLRSCFSEAISISPEVLTTSLKSKLELFN